jgi:hypothetical protein
MDISATDEKPIIGGYICVPEKKTEGYGAIEYNIE